MIYQWRSKFCTCELLVNEQIFAGVESDYHKGRYPTPAKAASRADIKIFVD
jgi:hypothetical protein